MALNFPVTPTVGAVYTAEDQSWIWDGKVWLARSDGMSVEGSDARYLKLTGGAMTGPVVFNRAVNTNYNSIYFNDAGAVTRWGIIHGNTPDGPLMFTRYTAAGVFELAPLSLSAAGGVNINGDLWMSSALPRIDLQETDQAANMKNWIAYVSGGQFNIQPRADDGAQPATGGVFRLSRDATGLTDVQWISAPASSPSSTSLLTRTHGDARYLNLTGGTLTGNLNLTGATVYQSGTQPGYHLTTDGAAANTKRWCVQGSGNPSQFSVVPRDDDGTLQTGSFSIQRDATGVTDARLSGTLAAPTSTSIMTRERGDARYLNSTGGVLTGAIYLRRAAVANVNSVIYQDTDNATRWVLQHENVVDGKFRIVRYSTSAAFQDCPISIASTNGVVTFQSAIVNGASDATLKANIAPMTGALDKVMMLQGRSFNMLSTPDKTEIGLIAQEVEPVLPELIQHFDHHITEDETVPKMAVDYSRLTAVLVEAIKELRGIVAAQAGRLNQLEAQVD